jgi:hypothetical protein
MTTREDKELAWRDMLKRAKSIRDGLGMPIDKPIIEIVVILRLLGFNTTGSCSGHIRRITSGPYVNIQSVKSLDYTERALKITDTDSDEYRRLRRRADYYRAQDLQRLVAYLSDFYAYELPHGYSSHLIIQSMPTSWNILKCQGAEIARIGDIKTKTEIVRENQGEMARFAEYLKNEFFKD